MTDQKDKPADKPQIGSIGDLDIGTMKKGDYMIHVFIESGKNFLPEGVSLDEGQKVFNGIIQMDCCGETRYSSTMEDCLVNSDDGHYLGEHFFFEPRDMDADAIQAENLTIKVLDKGFFKNKQVGCFDLDVAQIYFKNDQHSIHH